MKRKTLVIPFRKKRSGRTNYRKRLRLLQSGKPRLVVRKTLKHVILQIMEYAADGDKVLASAHSGELKKHGWKAATGNLPAAYLTGLLLAHRAGKANVCIADIGFHESVRGARIYAALKGAADGGLHVALDERMVPSAERLHGAHINEHMRAAVDDVKAALLKEMNNGSKE